MNAEFRLLWFLRSACVLTVEGTAAMTGIHHLNDTAVGQWLVRVQISESDCNTGVVRFGLHVDPGASGDMAGVFIRNP